MTRPIITDTVAQAVNPSAQAAGPTPTHVAVVSAAAPQNPADTLAGAFPAWDLVPMQHFVRRVK